MYKSPCLLSRLFWKNNQVVKRGWKYHGCAVGKNIKKGKGKQYLPCNIKAFLKKIKLGGGDGSGKIFWDEKERYKKYEGGEEYEVVGNFIHPC